MILAKNYLGKLNSTQIFDLAKFVVDENFSHHADNNLPEEYANDIKSICNEEAKYYNDSEIYVSKNDLGSISGAIRVLKWNYIDELPIQKIFGINPLLALRSPKINDIYHIGRFAISKTTTDKNLFKKLMVLAITPICKEEGNIAFAECDSKLLRILNLLGIKTHVIGDSIEYLGSETIPVAMTSEGLMNFYNKYKHLVSEELITPNNEETYRLPKSVVFNGSNQSYPLV